MGSLSNGLLSEETCASWWRIIKIQKCFLLKAIFLTAEMLATYSSDVLHDKIDQHNNDCFKNVWDGQLAIRDGQRFEPLHFPKRFSTDWFT